MICESDSAYILRRTIPAERGYGSPCWEWQGSKHDGYGKLWPRSGQVRAHRLAYQAFKGEIPAGLDVDHLCRNRCCCNPDHLEAVTEAENARRATKVRAWTPPMKIACKRGHRLTPDNRTPNGRNCRQCELDRNARRRVEREEVAA